MQNPLNSLNSLPNELLSKIFDTCSIQELLPLRAVDRDTKEIFKNYIDNYTSTDNSFKGIDKTARMQHLSYRLITNEKIRQLGSTASIDDMFTMQMLCNELSQAEQSFSSYKDMVRLTIGARDTGYLSLVRSITSP